MSAASKKQETVKSFIARSSIRRKLMGIIMGVSSAALILAGILIGLYESASFRQYMVHRRLQETQVIGNNCLAAVSFDDQDDASVVLRTLSSQASLAYANVSRADGTILADHRRDGFSDKPQPLPVGGSYEYTDQWLLTRAPIVLDGKRIGTSFIQSDLSEFTAFYQRTVIIVSAILLAVLMLTWLVSQRLQKAISKPLENLTELARDVSRHGDYSLRTSSISNDEIGVLAMAFNDMLSQVELRDEQLERAERLKSIGILAGGVAHDLNNILGPMVALPQLIHDDLDKIAQGDAEARTDVAESLAMMKVSANRAANVVRDLVALSRRGHFDLIPADINRMPCLTMRSSCIQSLNRSHPEVKIELHTAREAIIVKASENHLCRVVDNLIRNAVEAIEGEGSVHVTIAARHLAEAHSGYVTVPRGDYATIQVADNGTGMSQEDLERIFEPFYTMKKKTAASGTGLGLSIVLGIVEDHAGYIDVESETGKGTKFTLYLPIEAQLDAEPAVDNQVIIRGNGRILVVDDEPAQRHLARNCLTRMGYEVDCVEDGHLAVGKFADANDVKASSPYELILMDMVMEPGFDGLDALTEILDLYPEQKVIIASGHAEDDRSAGAIKLGAQWLPKPYTLSGLSNAVASRMHGDSDYAI